MYISTIIAVIILIGIPLSLPSVAFSTIVDYEDEPEAQEECEEESEEESDYDFLCSGAFGVEGKPFCDLHNATESIKVYSNMTEQGCWYRTINPIAWCEMFDDLTSTYEYCREVPGSEEYFEYIETGGPDESCLFEVYQIKCQPFPNAAGCPEDFGMNEDGYCFPTHQEECPEGYHGEDDDETGQCYPDEDGCSSDSFVMLEREDDKGNTCSALFYICDNEEHREREYCTEYCNEDPDRYGCRPE